ncbi:MAG TPA: MBL fold metallo-hydrolase, partial [Symbiobacteriaceae bacterium]|nr:MBL fold metallo-hydrolase [Symbiobacteriaceae bacterium]
AMDPVGNAANHSRIPMLPLPIPVDELLAGVDAVLLSHLHRDHFDEAAAALLPKALPILCQPVDAQQLSERGFQTVLPLADASEHLGIEFIRTDGRHGIGLIGQKMGTVSGFVLRAPGEPVLYIAGDTVWCGAVRESLETFRPDVVVVNAGAAQYLVGTPITMDGLDIARVCATAPEAAVIATHMDTINHCLLTREGLRADLTKRGLVDRVLIPADGETLSFPGNDRLQ